MSAESQSPNPFVVDSERFDPTGKFWLDPDKLQEVADMINDTGLPMMHLGAETHANELPSARRELKELLLSTHERLASEITRSLDIGYTYGSLIAHGSNSEATQAAPVDKLPANLAQDVQDALAGLDLETDADNYVLFMKLRNLELKYAQSDVLAFSLAISQDHLLDQFMQYGADGKEYSEADLTLLQTTFYAGALVGGMLHATPEQLQKTPIQILRGMRGPSDYADARLQFDAGDQLIESIDHALGMALTFRSIIKPGGNSYVAVMPGVMQYGPNALSIPMFVDEVFERDDVAKIPMQEVKGLFVVCDDENGTAAIELWQHPDMLPPRSTVVGMLTGDDCIGVYEASHPNADHLLEMARQLAPNYEYKNTFEITRLESKPVNMPRRFAAVGSVAVASMFAVDGFRQAAGDTENTNWGTDAAIAGIAVLLCVALTRGYKQLKKVQQKNDTVVQDMLDSTRRDR